MLSYLALYFLIFKLFYIFFFIIESDSDILFNINMHIYITQRIVCFIIKLSIHVYVLEIGQRLISRYRATTNFEIFH